MAVLSSSWICLLGRGFAWAMLLSKGPATSRADRTFCLLGLWEALVLSGAPRGEAKAGPGPKAAPSLLDAPVGC